MRYTVAVGGAGGHGVLVFGRLLALAGMHRLGHVAFVPVYDPEIHGSPVNSFVVMSTDPIVTPVVSRYDAVIAFDDRAARDHVPTVAPDGMVFVNSSIVRNIPEHDGRLVEVPASAEANALGNPKLLNMVMLGAVVAATRDVVEMQDITDGLREILPERWHHLIPDNERALAAGAELVASLV